jgi:hypothetical protein
MDYIFVSISGEHPAAMQHGNTGISQKLSVSKCWISLSLRFVIELLISVITYNYYI